MKAPTLSSVIKGVLEPFAGKMADGDGRIARERGQDAIDAARYRWITSQIAKAPFSIVARPEDAVIVYGGANMTGGPTLDAVIDYARKGSTGELPEYARPK